jgi:DNA repair exonuclease SbcCD ATPase subunit
VTYLGFDCFDYVTSNVTTVFSALKNFKRTGRALLAQLVWSARRAYQGSFAVSEKILPSYLTQEKRQELLIGEQEFQAVLNGRVQAQDRLNVCEKELKISREKEEDCRQKQDLLKREYEEWQMKFMGLESRKDDYINNRKTEDEKKNYYSEVNETKRQLDKAQADFERIDRQLAELQQKIERQDSERNVALLNFEVVKSKTDDEVKKRTVKLKNTWQAFYFRFAFAEDVFEQLVVNFTSDNILSIERLLKEMHDSKDIAAFAYEKNEENATTYCHMRSGKNAVIVYNKTYIVRISVEM